MVENAKLVQQENIVQKAQHLAYLAQEIKNIVQQEQLHAQHVQVEKWQINHIQGVSMKILQYNVNLVDI